MWQAFSATLNQTGSETPKSTVPLSTYESTKQKMPRHGLPPELPVPQHLVDSRSRGLGLEPYIQARTLQVPSNRGIRSQTKGISGL